MINSVSSSNLTVLRIERWTSDPNPFLRPDACPVQCFTTARMRLNGIGCPPELGHSACDAAHEAERHVEQTHQSQDAQRSMTAALGEPIASDRDSHPLNELPDPSPDAAESPPRNPHTPAVPPANLLGNLLDLFA